MSTKVVTCSFFFGKDQINKKENKLIDKKLHFCSLEKKIRYRVSKFNYFSTEFSFFAKLFQTFEDFIAKLPIQK